MDPTGPTGLSERLPDFGLSEAGSGCAVKLAVFEGPLDLLLHLIRQSEVDVTDIPIGAIADQYLEYLALMQELNLDMAGEYLLMAATLAWIKSRLLLPSLESEEDEGPDPRAELVARLLEYQHFKEAASGLGDRTLLDRDVFAARAAELEPVPEGAREIEAGLPALLEALRRVLQRRRGTPHAHEVELESVTVRDRMLAIMESLQHAEVVTFESLIERPDGTLASRPTIVASFLAVLELARLAAVRLYQGLGADGVPSGPIRLRRAPGDTAWGERISELM
jgi:segregation and condensation protein A